MEYFGTFLILFSFLFVGTKCDDAVYALKFKDKIGQCEDFDNKVIDCSEMGLMPSKGDDGDEAKLCGKITTSDEILCDYDVDIDILKICDMGNEYMWNMRMPFGNSLKDTDSPLYLALQTANITECPVPSRVIEIPEIIINLSAFQDVMCHEYCGDYIIILTFYNINTKVSCHTLLAGIFEKEK